MNLKSVYREYIKRHPKCFYENDNVKFNQKVGALFTEYFMNEYGWFKEEIREIDIDRIADMYFQTKNKLGKVHQEALTFEEFIEIFKDVERKNLDKIIKYRIV